MKAKTCDDGMQWLVGAAPARVRASVAMCGPFPENERPRRTLARAPGSTDVGTLRCAVQTRGIYTPLEWHIQTRRHAFVQHVPDLHDVPYDPVEKIVAGGFARLTDWEDVDLHSVNFVALTNS